MTPYTASRDKKKLGFCPLKSKWLILTCHKACWSLFCRTYISLIANLHFIQLASQTSLRTHEYIRNMDLLSEMSCVWISNWSWLRSSQMWWSKPVILAIWEAERQKDQALRPAWAKWVRLWQQNHYIV
jgi:hypothetical protein